MRISHVGSDAPRCDGGRLPGLLLWRAVNTVHHQRSQISLYFLQFKKNALFTCLVRIPDLRRSSTAPLWLHPNRHIFTSAFLGVSGPQGLEIPLPRATSDPVQRL